MVTFTLERDVWLPRPLDDVFAFFADARNLERLTPPSLRFELLGGSAAPMHVGMRLDYRIRLYGLPIRWQSEITVFEPPLRFVDEQRRGPYRRWVHTHTFEARDDGTVVRDHVEYAVPGGRLVQRLLVQPDLDRIFAYRRRVLLDLFGDGSR